MLSEREKVTRMKVSSIQRIAALFRLLWAMTVPAFATFYTNYQSHAGCEKRKASPVMRGYRLSIEAIASFKRQENNTTVAETKGVGKDRDQNLNNPQFPCPPHRR